MQRFTEISARGAVARVVRRLASAFAGIVLLAGAATTRADLIVPAGSIVTLNAGTADLACTDVTVAGTLQVGAGSLANVRHLTIAPGGLVDGGAGAIALGGNWNNTGSFVAGSSVVRFRDLCGIGNSTVAGNTSFGSVSFVSGTGKTYSFAIGATQTVVNLLEIAGTASQPIQFRSTSAGQTGFINLLGTGSQQIQHVGVTDVWATGQHLAPTLTNEGGGGNANGWFGGNAPVAVEPIPTVSDVALFALVAMLGWLGAFRLRRRSALRRSTRH